MALWYVRKCLYFRVGALIYEGTKLHTWDLLLNTSAKEEKQVTDEVNVSKLNIHRVTE